MKVRNILYIFSLYILHLNAEAAGYMDLKALTQDAKFYLQSEVHKDLPDSDHKNVNITSSTLDQRLKLHRCDKPLTFTHSRSSTIKGTVSVKVSCHSPHAWSIYTKHKVALEKHIVVADKNLLKNHILSSSDLSFVKRNIYNERAGYSDNKASLIGQQLKRPIAKGYVIYHNLLTQADVIKKGDTVNVIATVGQLSVITSGVALSNGRMGEQIDVENRRSSRIIRVEITGKNAVKVIM